MDFKYLKKKIKQKPMKLPVLSQNQTSGSLGFRVLKFEKI
jgi:hypothetical protein